jgi:15-cis-phytoene synthase
MKLLYDELSIEVSERTTKKYSTSFSLGILCIDKSIRNAIYQIYGFVRIADEIVDSFHDFDKESLLDEFEKETYQSISRKISTNPILNSFQEVVNKYKIDHKLIAAFLESMRMDLKKVTYDLSSYNTYIYGSAEVVGLMCLHVFVEGDIKEYDRLAPEAKKLGSAFQKINFLRDINADSAGLGRVYFPKLDLSIFDNAAKMEIVQEISEEFDEALLGIKKLPTKAKFGVFLAYSYYRELSNKILKMDAKDLLLNRASVSKPLKIWLLITSYIRFKFNKL